MSIMDLPLEAAWLLLEAPGHHMAHQNADGSRAVLHGNLNSIITGQRL
jgi:hypothetical protein